MVQVTYKKKGIRLTHVWFADKDELARLMDEKHDADILFVHGGNYTNLPHSVNLDRQNSLIKTLSDDEETAYQTFGKHLRKFIQRSVNEGTRVVHYTGLEITDDILGTCLKLYNKMKANKGLPGTFNTLLAKQYAKSGNLWVHMALVENIPVGFRACIVDDCHLRGWVSAFAFREKEFDSHVIGRAHRLLEWETMRCCCQNGIKSYDFGGINSFEEPNGIDEFKIEFAKEGQRVSYDNYLVGVSLLGKIAVCGYKLMKKIRK